MNRKPQPSLTFHVHPRAPLQPTPQILFEGAPIDAPRISDQVHWYGAL
jgi:hypothetical protein